MRPIYQPANPVSFQRNYKSSADRANSHFSQSDSKMSDTIYFGKTKDRKKNYSESEASLINQYILIHHDELYGLNGQDTTPTQRLLLWQNLTDHVNALGVEHRTVLEIKKRWQVVKVRVKKLLIPQKGVPVGHLSTEEAQIACLIFPHLVADMGLPDGGNKGSVSSGSEEEAGPSPAAPQTDHATRLSQLQQKHVEQVPTSSSEEEEEEGQLEEDPPQKSVPSFPKISMNTHRFPKISMNTHRFPKISMNTHRFPKIAMNAHPMRRMPPKACDTPPNPSPRLGAPNRIAHPRAIDAMMEYNGRRYNSKPRTQRRTPPNQGWHKILFRQQEEAHTSFAAMLKSLDKMADCLCNVPEQITDLSRKMEAHNNALMQHLLDESAARRAFEEKLLAEQKLISEKVALMVESSVGSTSADVSIAEALERLIGQPEKPAPNGGAESPQLVAPAVSEAVLSRIPAPREGGARSKPASGKRRRLLGRAGQGSGRDGWAA